MSHTSVQHILMRFSCRTTSEFPVMLTMSFAVMGAGCRCNFSSVPLAMVCVKHARKPFSCCGQGRISDWFWYESHVRNNFVNDVDIGSSGRLQILIGTTYPETVFRTTSEFPVMLTVSLTVVLGVGCRMPVHFLTFFKD